MSQETQVISGRAARALHVNQRDPLAERMLAPGADHALEEVLVAGYPQQQFVGAARNLAGVYRQAMAYGDRLMVVQDDVRLTYDEAFAQAAALADILRSRFGVTRGTKVAVVMGNRAEWIVASGVGEWAQGGGSKGRNHGK